MTKGHKQFFKADDIGNSPEAAELSPRAKEYARRILHKMAIDWTLAEAKYTTSKLSYRKLAEMIYIDEIVGWRTEELTAISAEYYSHYAEPLKPYADTLLVDGVVAGLTRRIEHQGRVGKWQEKRAGHSARIIKLAMEGRAEEEAQEIRALKDKERHDCARAIARLDALMQAHEQNAKRKGEYLFTDMNEEAAYKALDQWVGIRERLQKILYKSYDIAARVEMAGSTLPQIKDIPDEEIDREFERLLDE